MRFTRQFLVVCALVVSAPALAAQITLINNTPFGKTRYATTTGSAHSIDKTNVQIGAGSCARAAATANTSYLDTGIVLDPNSNGMCSKADKGFTIQFWYRPSAPSTFQYLFGDGAWSGASGQFRCFQNGTGGAGNLYIRGPLGQRPTTGAPLTSARNAKGWVHFAVVQNNTKSTLTWYVNGALNVSGPSTGTGKGTNFTCMGYNGTSSAGTTGNFDDFRIYNWARTAGDIAADYTKAAVGAGPSGCLNLPDEGYYQCETAVNPHIGAIGLAKEPAASFTRLFTVGDTIEWSATSPAKGPFVAVCLLDVFVGSPGSPRKDAYGPPPALPGGPYLTTFVPGLALGSAFSTPAYPASLFWPVAVSYGNGSIGKTSLTMPNLGLANGDRVDFQWIVIDPTYPPAGFGTTNNMTCEFVAAKAATAAHVEARGGSAGNDIGFWEVWNTGVLGIKQVCIDFSTMTSAVTWTPAGTMNTGGTLAGGDSFRNLTDVICDLTPKNNPRYTLSSNNQKLCFNFACQNPPANGFQGPTNHFIFDCATSQNYALTGAGYIGATVTVTFCNNQTKTGKLIADPKDAQAAQVDL